MKTPVSSETWNRLLRRNGQDETVQSRVSEILTQVQLRGLEAVSEYTKAFDKVDVASFVVDRLQIKAAIDSLTLEEKEALITSIESVRGFCVQEKKDITNTIVEGNGSKTVLRLLPVGKVGVYAPAGKAPLPSSVIMAAIPAQVAGVRNIVLASPPQADGKINRYILAAAGLCGIEGVYAIGGAQAIGALAYVYKVDVIAGPGNVYVSTAKQIVQSQGRCRVDLLAGPSEVLIIADETADPQLIAADMLAQAEHGPTSAAICLTPNKSFAKELEGEVERQLKVLNDPITSTAIKNYGTIILTKNMEEAIALSNDFAPEHVEVYAKNAETVAEQLINAGAVFVGTAEVFGDYGFDGSNHILPTGRAARFSGGVSVRTFMKGQYVKYATAQAQRNWADTCANFASMERLKAHEISARLRRE